MRDNRTWTVHGVTGDPHGSRLTVTAQDTCSPSLAAKNSMSFSSLSSEVQLEIVKIYPLGDPDAWTPKHKRTPPQSDLMSVLLANRQLFYLVHPMVRWSRWSTGQPHTIQKPSIKSRTIEIANAIKDFHKVMYARESILTPSQISHCGGFMNITHVWIVTLDQHAGVFEALKCLRIEDLKIPTSHVMTAIRDDISLLRHLKRLSILNYVSVSVCNGDDHCIDLGRSAFGRRRGIFSM